MTSLIAYLSRCVFDETKGFTMYGVHAILCTTTLVDSHADPVPIPVELSLQFFTFQPRNSSSMCTKLGFIQQSFRYVSR